MPQRKRLAAVPGGSGKFPAVGGGGQQTLRPNQIGGGNLVSQVGGGVTKPLQVGGEQSIRPNQIGGGGGTTGLGVSTGFQASGPTGDPPPPPGSVAESLRNLIDGSGTTVDLGGGTGVGGSFNPNIFNQDEGGVDFIQGGGGNQTLRNDIGLQDAQILPDGTVIGRSDPRFNRAPGSGVSFGGTGVLPGDGATGAVGGLPGAQIGGGQNFRPLPGAGQFVGNKEPAINSELNVSNAVTGGGFPTLDARGAGGTLANLAQPGGAGGFVSSNGGAVGGAGGSTRPNTVQGGSGNQTLRGGNGTSLTGGGLSAAAASKSLSQAQLDNAQVVGGGADIGDGNALRGAAVGDEVQQNTALSQAIGNLDNLGRTVGNTGPVNPDTGLTPAGFETLEAERDALQRTLNNPLFRNIQNARAQGLDQIPGSNFVFGSDAVLLPQLFNADFQRLQREAGGTFTPQQRAQTLASLEQQYAGVTFSQGVQVSGGQQVGPGNFRTFEDFNQQRLAEVERLIGLRGTGTGTGTGTGNGTGEGTGDGGGDLGVIDPSAAQGTGAPFPNQGAVNQVGGDPLSQDITRSIRELLQSGGSSTTGFGQGIEGAIQELIDAGGSSGTGFGQGIEGSIQDLIANGGNLDQGVIDQRLESAIEGLNTLEQGRVSALDARLADRGFSGGSGIGKTGLENISRDIASIGASEFRNIQASEREAANNRFVQGLGLGTGLNQSQQQNLLGTVGLGANVSQNNSQNLLNAIGQGTGRQQVLSDIALQSLRENNDFAQFLAEFGLERDRTLEQIQQGRLNQFMPLIQLFQSLAQQSAQGFIGN